MKLLVEVIHNVYFVTPTDEEDMGLFKHCTFGRSTVPLVEFKSTIRPLLMAHGCYEYEVEYATKKEQP
jgi:hypothetical protein